jgi:pyridoxamine 5'-phosphate oxidase family protein
MAEFTSAQIKYLESQRLGRLATLRPDGTLQNNPVGFTFVAETGTFEIGGYGVITTCPVTRRGRTLPQLDHRTIETD